MRQLVGTQKGLLFSGLLACKTLSNLYTVGNVYIG